MIFVFGSITVDFVFPVTHLPQPGHTLRSEWRDAVPGGHGANQAIAAARDGAAVVMAGAVGRDPLAETALQGLLHEGVDVQHVLRVSVNTGRAAITVDRKGLTTTVVDLGANLSARAAQAPDRLLGPGTTLIVQMEVDLDETAALVLRARGLGCRVIVNVAPAQPMATDALRAASLVIGNNPEIAWLGEHLGTGNNPASIHGALGVPTIRMMGAQGAEAMSDEGYMMIAAMPVLMRDTTGAADCFVGVLAAALDRGATLRHAMRRASVAAGLASTTVGAQASMPQAAAIDASLARSPQVTTMQPELSG